MVGDFQDLTPPPDPIPKRVFMWPNQADPSIVPLLWPANTTFASFLNNNLPVALKQHQLLSDANVLVTIRLVEV